MFGSLFSVGEPATHLRFLRLNLFGFYLFYSAFMFPYIHGYIIPQVKPHEVVPLRGSFSGPARALLSSLMFVFLLMAKIACKFT